MDRDVRTNWEQIISTKNYEENEPFTTKGGRNLLSQLDTLRRESNGQKLTSVIINSSLSSTPAIEILPWDTEW